MKFSKKMFYVEFMIFSFAASKCEKMQKNGKMVEN